MVFFIVAYKETFQTSKLSFFIGWENFNLQAFSPFFHYFLYYSSFFPVSVSVLIVFVGILNWGLPSNFQKWWFEKGIRTHLVWARVCWSLCVVDTRVLFTHVDQCLCCSLNTLWHTIITMSIINKHVNIIKEKRYIQHINLFLCFFLFWINNISWSSLVV